MQNLRIAEFENYRIGEMQYLGDAEFEKCSICKIRELQDLRNAEFEKR